MHSSDITPYSEIVSILGFYYSKATLSIQQGPVGDGLLPSVAPALFLGFATLAMARSTLDDFLLKEKIGTGSYGAVYRATRKVDRYGGKLQTCCWPATMQCSGASKLKLWRPASDIR
jgi:hypothetical protein